MSEVRRETGLVSRLAVAAGDIKLAHSIFALPFAVLGGAMAIEAGARRRRICSLVRLSVARLIGLAIRRGGGAG